MPMIVRQFRIEFALLVVLALLWGSSFTLIKIAVDTIPPASLTAGRIALAALVLLAVMRWRGTSLPSTPELWLHLLVQSIINLALPFLLISWGEQHVSSGLASILTTTAPLFAFAIAALTGHAARGASQALGLVCGFGGVILIIGTGALEELGGPQLASQLALVGAGVLWLVLELRAGVPVALPDHRRSGDPALGDRPDDAAEPSGRSALDAGAERAIAGRAGSARTPLDRARLLDLFPAAGDARHRRH